MFAVACIAVALLAAGAVVGSLALVAFCLDQRADIGLLSSFVDGARQREAAAVRRAERAERRATAAEAHTAALSTFDEEPPRAPFVRAA